jgi:hypothetical protein
VLFRPAATEIQNIQIAEDEVCRNLPIPMYMVFPRLFTCSTMITSRKSSTAFLVVLSAVADGYAPCDGRFQGGVRGQSDYRIRRQLHGDRKLPHHALSGEIVEAELSVLQAVVCSACSPHRP